MPTQADLDKYGLSLVHQTAATNAQPTGSYYLTDTGQYSGGRAKQYAISDLSQFSGITARELDPSQTAGQVSGASQTEMDFDWSKLFPTLEGNYANSQLVNQQKAFATANADNPNSSAAMTTAGLNNATAPMGTVSNAAPGTSQVGAVLANGQAPGGLQMPSGIAAGSVFDPISGKQVSPQEAAFNATQASGKTAPQTSSEASGQVQTAIDGATPSITPPPPTTPNVDNFFATNQTLQQQTQELMDFLSPPEQTKRFAEEAAKIKADKDVLAGLNLQDMNIERIKSGTADDIRSEITKTGGFATESQIMGLTVARNNTLIKDQNLLRQKINTQQNLINNEVSLLQEEKQMAAQQFNQRSQIYQLVQQNQRDIQNAARDSVKTLMNTPGGLAAYMNDPRQAAYADQIMGFAPGTVTSLAYQQQGEIQRQQKVAELEMLLKSTQLRKTEAEIAQMPLENEYKKAQINQVKAQTANIYNEIKNRDIANIVQVDQAGKVVPKPVDAMKINKEMYSSDAYKALTKAKDSLQFLKGFEETFKKTGSTSAVFSPRQNADLKAKYNTAILNLKEFFNLGVLNGPDEKILRGVLPDPTNTSATLQGLSFGIYNPSKGTEAGIKNMKKMIETTIDDRYKTLASQYGGYSSQSVSGIGDLNRTYIEQKSILNPNISKMLQDNPELTYDDIIQIIAQ